MEVKKIVVSVVVSILVLLTVWSAIYVVDPGYRGVLVTLGKVSETSYPNGVGLKMPFISKMKQLDVRTLTYTAQTESYTSDVQSAEFSYTVTYDLNEANVPQLYAEVGVDYEAKKLTPVLNDVLKDVIGRWTAMNLIANRDKARGEVLEGLKARLDARFFQNLTFQITDIRYSDTFEKSINAKVEAEQKALEAVNNTRRIKEEAEQKVISAKAEAEAMEIKAKALASNKSLIEYEAIKRWNGILPTTMAGNAVPFVNIGGK